jgi:surface polysaccharide O-acyltransferase-like enzyme
MTTNIKRYYYADLLRIVATFGVIINHVGASGWGEPSLSFDWQVMNFFHCLCRWPVQIFVMISGMLLLRLGGRISLLKGEKY